MIFNFIKKQFFRIIYPIRRDTISLIKIIKESDDKNFYYHRKNFIFGERPDGNKRFEITLSFRGPAGARRKIGPKVEEISILSPDFKQIIKRFNRLELDIIGNLIYKKYLKIISMEEEKEKNKLNAFFDEFLEKKSENNNPAQLPIINNDNPVVALIEIK